MVEQARRVRGQDHRDQVSSDGEGGEYPARGKRPGGRLKSAVTMGRSLVTVWCDQRVMSTFVECGWRAMNMCSCVIRGMDTW